ncbi:MAG: glycosyltransferase family 39 protein [Chloroflexi bacterium]|nr:glycosyltransferase family 39 protein [Chloroflexota bacterium]
MKDPSAGRLRSPRWVLPSLLAILALYLIVAVSYATATPPWQAPDEPAHYNVVRQLAEDGAYPLIEDGDWNQAYLEQLKAARFAPELLARLDTVQFEDHQPPLYYLLLVPVYNVSGGDLVALRVASAAMGLIVVLAAYAVAARTMPDRPAVALGTATLVAFVPQHVHILASVNNDALAWALVGWILWASISHAAGGRVPAWALGVLVGIALLTKTTAYLMAGVALLAVVLRPHERGLRGRMTAASAYLVVALGIGAVWWLRNIGVYGFPDFLGLAAHDAVVIGQTRTADYMAKLGTGPYFEMAFETTVTSFIGQFGWMALPIQTWVLAIYGAIAAVGTAGAIALRALRHSTPRAWLLMGVTGVLALLMLVYYNMQFVQFQGRYVYPILIPLAALVCAGLDAIRQRLPIVKHLPVLLPVALSAFAALDLWLLTRVLVPNLTP